MAGRKILISCPVFTDDVRVFRPKPSDWSDFFQFNLAFLACMSEEEDFAGGARIPLPFESVRRITRGTGTPPPVE